MTSKLGFLLYGNPGNWLGHIERMRPTVSGVIDFDDPATLDILKQHSQFVVYRHYAEPGLGMSPEKFISEIPTKLFGYGLCFQGICEPYVKTKEEAENVSAWYQVFGELMKGKGEKTVAFDFSTGNPPIEIVPYLDPGPCDFIGLHEYYSSSNGYYMMQMHRAFYGALKPSARRPIIITECGWDEGMGYPDGDGWLGHVHASPGLMMDVFKTFDSIVMADDYVVGSIAFQLGAGGPWASFALDTLANNYANYVQAAGGGKVFTGGTTTPEYWIKVSPTTIKAGESAVIETYGEGIKGGWLYGGEFNGKGLAPVTGHKETVKPTQATIYTLKVQLVDDSIDSRTATVSVTSEPVPPTPGGKQPLNPNWPELMIERYQGTGGYWKLHEWEVIKTGDGMHALRVQTYKDGKPALDVVVEHFYPYDHTDETETAETEMKDVGGGNWQPVAEFIMGGGGSSNFNAEGHGPHNIAVQPNSDKVYGAGMPMNEHRFYRYVYEWRTQNEPPPPPSNDLEEAIAASKLVTAYLESLRE